MKMRDQIRITFSLEHFSFPILCIRKNKATDAGTTDSYNISANLKKAARISPRVDSLFIRRTHYFAAFTAIATTYIQGSKGRISGADNPFSTGIGIKPTYDDLQDASCTICEIFKRLKGLLDGTLVLLTLR